MAKTDTVLEAIEKSAKSISLMKHIDANVLARDHILPLLKRVARESQDEIDELSDRVDDLEEQVVSESVINTLNFSAQTLVAFASFVDTIMLEAGFIEVPAGDAQQVVMTDKVSKSTQQAYSELMPRAAATITSITQVLQVLNAEDQGDPEPGDEPGAEEDATAPVLSMKPISKDKKTEGAANGASE